MTEPFRLLVTASRDWSEPGDMWKRLQEARAWANGHGRILLVVHGDAPGGDQIAKLFGQIVGGAYEEGHPADWEGPCTDRCQPEHRRKRRDGTSYCPAAGMYRNEAMVALGAERAFAFIRNRSHGASGCARLAEKAGIKTRRYSQ